MSEITLLSFLVNIIRQINDEQHVHLFGYFSHHGYDYFITIVSISTTPQPSSHTHTLKYRDYKWLCRYLKFKKLFQDVKCNLAILLHLKQMIAVLYIQSCTRRFLSKRKFAATLIQTLFRGLIGYQKSLAAPDGLLYRLAKERFQTRVFV